jgi:hypothetical protein
MLFRKSGSAGNRIRDLWVSSQELSPLDNRGGRRIPASTVNYRPVLSLERMPHTNKPAAVLNDFFFKKEDKSVAGPGRMPDAKTDYWPTDCSDITSTLTKVLLLPN